MFLAKSSLCGYRNMDLAHICSLGHRCVVICTLDDMVCGVFFLCPEGVDVLTNSVVTGCKFDPKTKQVSLTLNSGKTVSILKVNV